MDSKKMTNVNVRNLSKALGNFDGVFGQHLSGWYLHKGSNQAAQLSVYVNGELFETVSCDRNRPDVQSNLGYGRKSGFFVDLSKLPSGKVHQITMLDEQYGFDFNGLSIAFSGDVAGYADKLREIFVADYYIQKNKLLHVKLNQAFEHYISRGVYQGFSPCPWFDQEFVLSQIKDDDVLSSPAVVEYLKREQELKLKPCEVFDPAAYLRSNPDLSKNMCLLGHYVKHGRFEGRKLGSEELPQSIIDELIELSAIEPKLNTVIDKTGFVVRYSMNGPGTFVAAMHESIYGKNIDAIVCVPFISIGGADLVATHVVRAYQEVYGADRVLLMVTDASSVELPQWLGKDTKVSLIGKDLAGCDPSRRVEVLHNTIARLNPKKLFNINSATTWQMVNKYGSQLSKFIDLHAYLFCFDYNAHGMPVGYLPDYLPAAIKTHRSILFDNKKILQNVEDIYGFFGDEREKLHTVYVPGEGEESRIEHQPEKDASILWVGRLSHQKRPELLVDIARQMPNQKFTVYGVEGNSPVSKEIMSGAISNIEFKGRFTDLKELDFNSYKFLLNTSKWEGLPTLLIRLMDVGLPIVTSDAGGISEIVNDKSGYLVKSDHASDFVQTINRALVSPKGNTELTKQGFKIIDEAHAWSTFMNSMRAASVFGDLPALSECA